MRFDKSILATRFGRRIFGLFLVCALVPIAALAVISYLSVRNELRLQAETRLADLAKSAGMGIWERLAMLETELEVVAGRLWVGGERVDEGGQDAAGDAGRHLVGLTVFGADGQIRGQIGTDIEIPALSGEERTHLGAGQPLLKLEGSDPSAIRALLGRGIRVGGEEPITVWGQIEPAYLWWGAPMENTLPARHELAVLDTNTRAVLFSSAPQREGGLEELSAIEIEGTRDGFEIELGGEPYQAHYRIVSLRPVFLHPGVTLVLAEPEAVVLQPLATFKRVFLAIVAITFLVVTLLSLHHIHKSLRPLQGLQEGTRKIARGDTSATVRIESDDEFAELAGSFNIMARSLDRQFATLRSLNELQQAVLSSLESDRLITTVLQHFARIFQCGEVVLCVLKPGCSGDAWVYSQNAIGGSERRVEATQLASAEIDLLAGRHQWLEIDLKAGRPRFIDGSGIHAPARAVAFPVFVGEDLAAVLTAGVDGPLPDRSDHERARQLADQVAVAWSNIRLVEQVDDLNWGILSALARAIDVRSHWTMGHTDRVTTLALRLGRALELSSQRLETLRRASLLHDLGKIGVPSEILDKPGKLTAEEMQQVREHVQLGVRIIEPIPALADIVPVVLQHHEWFDGQGYPAGLAGSEICLEARILSVADCYDALRSNRPYRPALRRSEVIAHLREGAGEQFDPRIVEVFLETISEPERPVRRPSSTSAEIQLGATRC